MMMRGGSPAALCTALEQLSLLTSTAVRCIATSTCRPSQSKFMRYDRSSSAIRQTNSDYDLSNLSQAGSTGIMSFHGKRPFPNGDTANQLFDGVRFASLPVVHIKATRNNTVITVNDAHTGHTIILQSAGTVGFRNAKKGTNVAAQAAAVAIAGDALRKEIQTVRVCVRGLGPGRQPAVKSLQMAGLNIVSISDTTRLPFLCNRPKKVRRL